MTGTRQFVVSAAAIAAVAILSSSGVSAQRGGREPAQPQDSQRRTGAAQRRTAPPPGVSRPAPAPQGRPDTRIQSTRPSQARPGRGAPPRIDTRPSRPQNGPQGRFDDRRPSGQGRFATPVPRYGTGPRYAVPDRSFSRPGFLAPRYRVQLSRPYYSFRPRVSIGFGIFVGVPFGYPSWYDPYRGYGGPYVGPRLTRYGGISFDIQPYDAEIYIDGHYAGCVADYSPYEGPLTLAAGRHWIELRAPGYRRLSFEITVVPGQVIPYRGSLPYGW